MFFNIKPLEGTTGVFVISAQTEEGTPVIRSQVLAENSLEAIRAFRQAIADLSVATFPEVTCA